MVWWYDGMIAKDTVARNGGINMYSHHQHTPPTVASVLITPSVCQGRVPRCRRTTFFSLTFLGLGGYKTYPYLTKKN